MPLATVNGHQIHYECVGPEAGTPVVFIHGVTLSLICWRNTVTRLPSDLRRISVDLLGHGESAKPRNADYSIEQQGQIVIGLLDCLGIDRATLVGHSMGGEIALWIASHHPERVSKVITVAAVTEGNLSAEANFQFGLMRFGMFLPSIGRFMASVARNPNLMGSTYFIRPQPASAFYEVYDEQQRADNYKSKAACLRAIYRYRALDDADKIKSPVMIISGDQDNVVPLGQSLKLKERLPDAALVRIPNCKHLPQYDAPEELNTALTSFLTT